MQGSALNAFFKTTPNEEAAHACILFSIIVCQFCKTDKIIMAKMTSQDIWRKWLIWVFDPYGD